MNEIKMYPEEHKTFNSVKRLAKTWPKSLWLFSGAGTLCVMRCGADGKSVFTDTGGIDQDFVLDYIKIPNSGGDW